MTDTAADYLQDNCGVFYEFANRIRMNKNAIQSGRNAIMKLE